MFLWDGRAASLEAQVLMPIEDPREMDSTVASAAARVGLSRQDLAKALASYVRSILSGDSAFDRFVAGDRNALTDQEQSGLQVFRSKGNCTACHVGPNFTDEHVHNTGVAWRNGQLADPGAGAGAFKTPTLREVARTAPYMHDGSLATLEDVVDFYDRGGNRNPFLDEDVRPIGFSTEERRALIAFFGALNGRAGR